MKFKKNLVRILLILSALALSVDAFAEGCEGALDGSRKLDRRGFVEVLATWLSPTQALLSAADNSVADTILNGNEYSAENARALIESNSSSQLVLTDDLLKAQAVVLAEALKDSQTLRLPKDPRSIFSRFAGRTRVDSERFEDVARQLWKIRPAQLDLRALNPQLFADVADLHRYQDTFRAQLEVLVNAFDVSLGRWPKNWGQWTEQVRRFLDQQFPDAKPSTRLFLIRTLEAVFLDLSPSSKTDSLLTVLQRVLPEKVTLAQSSPSPRIEQVYPKASVRNKAAPVVTSPVVTPVQAAKRRAVATYQILNSAYRDLKKLPENLQERFEEFLRIITFETNPAILLKSGSWQWEKLRMEKSLYSVRLNQAYRVIFKWDGSEYFIEHVDKTTTH